jgi:hypothetical protein
MKELRKISDIWKAIDDKRILSKMGKHKWFQSYEGIKAAIEYIGLKIITTKKELDAMEVPIDKNSIKHYGWRKINVSRDGIISNVGINSLLGNYSTLRTDEEMKEIYKKVGTTLSLQQPKGIPTANNLESKAIDDLDILIGISDYIHREHLFEFRLYDMAYCMINDDINAEIFVSDQVKSSKVAENGAVYFRQLNSALSIKIMISILENGSLTCIGKTREDKVDVVWFFYGINAINILKAFNINQTFNPTLHLKRKSNNEFINKMNDPMFRFDVGKSSEECNRLLENKIEFIKIGNKHSLIFWNEDDSQIPGKNHRIEQKSFAMTRTACRTIDIKVERFHENSYGSVDFIIKGYIRVQDKAASKSFGFRYECNLPYNPDDIDIFQVSNLENNLVYAIPMRVMKNEIITSFFTDKQLMKKNIGFGLKWKKDHEQFKYNFKTNEGIILYVKACEEASKIPELTDRNFYSNMIDVNKDKFGSKNQLADRKLNAVNV